MAETQEILILENIHKRFGDKVVHNGVDLRLRKGETLGLLGGSGSGKSLLLRSIIGLEFIDSGKILFKGQEIQDYSEVQFQKIRLEISYAFQNGALFDSQNVFENIAYPLFEHTKLSFKEIQEEVAKTLEMIDLEGIEEFMPSDLSGGMQKRVGLARAMIMDPKVILYDEPTAGLDPTNAKNIISIMQKLKDDEHSSIFVTHDIHSALEICDRICILSEGKVSFEGEPKDFLDSQNPIVKNFLIETEPQGTEHGH